MSTGSYDEEERAFHSRCSRPVSPYAALQEQFVRNPTFRPVLVGRSKTGAILDPTIKPDPSKHSDPKIAAQCPYCQEAR